MIPRAARHLVAVAAARAPLSAGGAPSLLADAAAAVAPASAAARPPAAPPARPFAAGKGQAALSRAGGPSMIRRGRVTSTGGGSGGVQSQRGQHSPGFVVQVSATPRSLRRRTAPSGLFSRPRQLQTVNDRHLLANPPSWGAGIFSPSRGHAVPRSKFSSGESRISRAPLC